MSANNKRVIAAFITLACAMSAAHADGSTSSGLPSDTLPSFANSGSLSFSQELLNALNVGGGNVTSTVTPSNNGVIPVGSGTVPASNSLTVTDLQVDLASKTIYASVITKEDLTSYLLNPPYQSQPSRYEILAGLALSLTPSVPEPSTFMLMGLGLAGLGLLKRRART